jgi:hypothetical protein
MTYEQLSEVPAGYKTRNELMDTPRRLSCSCRSTRRAVLNIAHTHYQHSQLSTVLCKASEHRCSGVALVLLWEAATATCGNATVTGHALLTHSTVWWNETETETESENLSPPPQTGHVLHRKSRMVLHGAYQRLVLKCLTNVNYCISPRVQDISITNSLQPLKVVCEGCECDVAWRDVTWRRGVPVGTNISEEHVAVIFRAERIPDLGTNRDGLII